jgi:hypothetical protein
VLQGFGGEPWQQMKAYRLCAKEGLLQGVDDPAAAMEIRSVLGRDSSADWVKREFLLWRAMTRMPPNLRQGQAAPQTGGL